MAKKKVYSYILVSKDLSETKVFDEQDQALDYCFQRGLRLDLGEYILYKSSLMNVKLNVEVTE